MICLWISQINNGILCKYKNKLLEHLIEDGIDGKDLKDINKHKNWKRYGIDTFVDRETLIVYVNDLMDCKKINIANKRKVNVKFSVDDSGLEDMYDNIEIEGASHDINTNTTHLSSIKTSDQNVQTRARH